MCLARLNGSTRGPGGTVSNAPATEKQPAVGLSVGALRVVLVRIYRCPAACAHLERNLPPTVRAASSVRQECTTKRLVEVVCFVEPAGRWRPTGQTAECARWDSTILWQEAIAHTFAIPGRRSMRTGQDVTCADQVSIVLRRVQTAASAAAGRRRMRTELHAARARKVTLTPTLAENVRCARREVRLMRIGLLVRFVRQVTSIQLPEAIAWCALLAAKSAKT